MKLFFITVTFIFFLVSTGFSQVKSATVCPLKDKSISRKNQYIGRNIAISIGYQLRKNSPLVYIDSNSGKLSDDSDTSTCLKYYHIKKTGEHKVIKKQIDFIVSGEYVLLKENILIEISIKNKNKKTIASFRASGLYKNLEQLTIQVSKIIINILKISS